METHLLAAWRAIVDFPGVAAMQNLHPLFVNFPIAFLCAAAALFWIAALSRSETIAWAAFWTLAAGAAAATLTVWTGLEAGNGVMVAPSVRAHILHYHRTLMLGVWAGSLALCFWTLLARPMPRRARSVFLVLLIALVVVLAHGADYGGWMVFGYNAGGSLPQPIEFQQ